MTRWYRRLGAILFMFSAAFGLLIQGAEPASACSCAMPNPLTGLASADGAFVGTLVDEEEQVGPMFDGGEMMDHLFEVEVVLKGDIGKTVVVESAADGAACGFEIPIGQRVGLTLTRNGDSWEGSLCATYGPDSLLDAANGLPEPVPGSPPHLVVPVDLGGTGMVALDRDGNIVGYGEGPVPWMTSACPDHRTFLAASSDTIIEVVSFTDLAVIDEIEVDATGGAWLRNLICTGPAGDQFLAIRTLSGEEEQSSLVRQTDDDTEVLAEDIEVLVDRPGAAPIAIATDGTLYEVDAETGATNVLDVALTGKTGYVVSAMASPDGSHVAVSTADWNLNPIEGDLFVVDLEEGSVVSQEMACDLYPVWLDNQEFAIHDCMTAVTSVYSTNLELVGEGVMPEWGSTGYVTDETGALFFPYGYDIRVLEPGTEESTKLTTLFTYPGRLLVVPQEAREAWDGPAYTPTPITETPVVTFPEDGLEPVPITIERNETPIWLMALGGFAVIAVLVMLLVPPRGKAAGREDEV